MTVFLLFRHDLELPVTMVNVPPLYEMFYDFLCPASNQWQQYEISKSLLTYAAVVFLYLFLWHCLPEAESTIAL